MLLTSFDAHTIFISFRVDTVTKAFNFAVAKFGSKACLGTRQVLGTMDEVQKNGKIFQKLTLGEYQWMSYDQVKETALCFGRGLRLLGLQPRTKISMYAETRAEWMISCLGAFSQSIHLCTVYTNLGDEGVIHALKETEAEVVVTSHELLHRFKNFLPSLPKITHIICMEDPLKSTPLEGFG